MARESEEKRKEDTDTGNNIDRKRITYSHKHRSPFPLVPLSLSVCVSDAPSVHAARIFGRSAGFAVGESSSDRANAGRRFRVQAVPKTFPLTDSEKAAVLAAFQTDSKALGMRDQAPRFGPKEISTDSDYYIGVGICLAIGVGIAILQLICTGWYMFLRCCCWRWCCKKRSDWEQPGFPGYLTFWSKYWPTVFLCILVAVACAFAIVGIVYNDELSKSFSDSNQEHGVGPLALNVLENLNNWINIINDKVVSIAQSITTIAEQIAIPSSIQGNSTELVSMTVSFTNHFGSGSYVTANGTNWYCNTQCQILGEASNTLGTKLNTDIIPILIEYDNTATTVRNDYQTQAYSISNELASATSSLRSAQSDVLSSSTRRDVRDYTSDGSDYDKIRNGVFLGLFCVIFLLPFIVGAGLFLRKACPFKFTFCIGPFYMFLIFILFGIHWCFGTLIGDGCVYFDTKIVDTAEVFKNEGSLSNIVNACLTNKSLITTLELEPQFKFKDDIVAAFPTILTTSQINDMFGVSGGGTDTLTSGVDTLNSYSFGFQEYEVIEGNTKLMNETQTTGGTYIGYTRQAILDCQSTLTSCYITPYPAASQTAMLTYHQQAYEGIQVYAAIQVRINEMRGNTTAITSKTDLVRNLVIGMSNDMER